MNTREYHLHDGTKGAALAIRVIPQGQKNEIVEIMPTGTIRIQLSAPPIEGKANQALVSFLSEVLGISKSKIEIIAGVGGRDKLVSVLEMDPDLVQQKILDCLNQS